MSNKPIYKPIYFIEFSHGPRLYYRHWPHLMDALKAGLKEDEEQVLKIGIERMSEEDYDELEPL